MEMNICIFIYLYDGQIGVVITIDEAEKDPLIRFMHIQMCSSGLIMTNASFYRMMMKLNQSSAISFRGRNYSIHPTDVKKLELLY